MNNIEVKKKKSVNLVGGKHAFDIKAESHKGFCVI